jgi:hypothetical protein
MNIYRIVSIRATLYFKQQGLFELWIGVIFEDQTSH